MSIRDSIGKKVKRELVRAMLERTQSMDTAKLMGALGAAGHAVYDDVEETLNIAYVNRAEVALAMDVFKPKAPEGAELPVIVLIHGGGLFMGDRGLDRPYARLLAHKGYLVFSLEYRLAPKANIGQQLDDVCAGMDQVGRMLVNYDVDFSRVFLAADSAGAYLAAYVAAMRGSVRLQEAIGYEPSRMVFAAVGFLCGVFYPNDTLTDQVFGEKRGDKEFRKLMNPEHPEIIRNLPPAFLVSSCGDTMNNHTLRFHEALKKNGRPSKLVFFGDEELMHIFMISDPEHPRSVEATDKMLAWFEEQAQSRTASRKKDPAVERRRRRLEKRMEDGSVNDQRMWSYVKECRSFDPALLEKTAVIDCTREYTYGQMFEEWDKYARVFTGLNITGENHSRAAIAGAVSAEPIFAFYGLNMTGAEVSMLSYPDFIPGGSWKAMLKHERITDLLIADIMVTKELWQELAQAREELGLRNILLIHSKMGGPAVGPAELTYNEVNRHLVERLPGAVFLDELIKRYADTPIRLDKSKGDRLALITHTSGTTKGSRKPLPYTDRSANAISSASKGGFRNILSGAEHRQLRVLMQFDLSSSLAMCGMVNNSFAAGDTVVLTFFGFLHPKFIRAVEYYHIDVLNVSGFLIDRWMERTDLADVSLSSLSLVGLGGSYVPPEKLKKYNEFLRAHGCQCGITRGYGMSEAGASQIMVPPDCTDDVLGFAPDDVTVRVRDEADGQFYSTADGVRTGVLYLVADAACGNELDGEVIFEYTVLDGKNYVCTNDLVRVNENGSLSYAGRADKYFVNNDGRRFDAGIVDVQMAAHPAVDRCAVAPVLEKRIHDTVPVLYAVPAEKSASAEGIRQALLDVYVRERKIAADNLPVQLVLVSDIPLNANGKLDIFRITRERLGGDAYNLVPVLEGGKLADIRLEHVEHVNSITAGTVPAGMENRSAYNIFDMFTAEPAADLPRLHPLRPWEMLMPGAGKKQAQRKMPALPEGVMKTALKYGNRLAGIPNGRKPIHFDFED